MAETKAPKIDDPHKKFEKKQLGKPKDYKRVFNTDAGKRVISDLIDTHFVMRSTIAATPEMTAFNEGQRNVVLRILTLLNIDEEQMKKRIEESHKYVQMVD